MSEAYGRIKEGLNEALAFANGQQTGAAVHRIEVSSVDAARDDRAQAVAGARIAGGVSENARSHPAP